MEKKKIIVAIDGYSSTGKSTMAKALARHVGYSYVDTGAMYRAVTLYCLENGIMASGGKVDEAKLQASLGNIEIGFKRTAQGEQHTYLNGVDVESKIRGMEVSSNVSPVAAIPMVRRALVAQQQAMGKGKGVVMDGRDIGTVVFPNAELKVFVTASAAVRARRRYDEMRAKGDDTVNYDEVLRNVEERDHIDTTRADSPLRQAPDAVVLDNSSMTVEQQNQWMLDLFEKTVNGGN